LRFSVPNSQGEFVQNRQSQAGTPDRSQHAVAAIRGDDVAGRSRTAAEAYAGPLAWPQIEFEDLMRMFEGLTGRPPTEEERAETLREWGSDDGES
jgi:hypothetical protein